jgi:hypothetical protein
MFSSKINSRAERWLCARPAGSQPTFRHLSRGSRGKEGRDPTQQERSQKILRNNLAAVSQSALCDGVFAALKSVRQIEQYAAHVRILLKDFENNLSVTSAHINDPFRWGKVIVTVDFNKSSVLLAVPNDHNQPQEALIVLYPALIVV